MNAAASVSVENVVASSAIGQELDLDVLSEDLGAIGTSNYHPGSFPGLVYRIRDPKAAVLIYRSGKVVCTGGKRVDDVEAAFARVFDELHELGIDVSDSAPIEVQNIVFSADLGKRLNLNAVAIGLGLESIEYEPEQFLGLIYRLTEPEVAVLLFGSGRLVITGGRQNDDAELACSIISERLDELGLFD